MQVVTDLARATGLAESVEGDGRRLNRVLQLTGFSDPVYAEAFVTVHQYDIVMDVTVLNRTRETLQVCRQTVCVCAAVGLLSRHIAACSGKERPVKPGFISEAFN